MKKYEEPVLDVELLKLEAVTADDENPDLGGGAASTDPFA